jgi:hypothetical protein
LEASIGSTLLHPRAQARRWNKSARYRGFPPENSATIAAAGLAATGAPITPRASRAAPARAVPFLTSEPAHVPFRAA